MCTAPRSRGHRRRRASDLVSFSGPRRPHEVVRYISQKFGTETFASHTVVFREGESAKDSSVFFILKGTVSVSSGGTELMRLVPAEKEQPPGVPNSSVSRLVATSQRSSSGGRTKTSARGFFGEVSLLSPPGLTRRRCLWAKAGRRTSTRNEHWVRLLWVRLACRSTA